MYTLSKGPSKIVAKTRRGLNQKIDSFESQRELIYGRKPGPGYRDKFTSSEMSAPRPVFQPVNGKRSTSVRVPPPETISPQHEEMVHFIYSEWNRVCREYDMNKLTLSDARPVCRIKYYEESEPNPELDNFEPFDLESWWGKRLYRNLTQSS